jgi:hypothetical protein
MESRKETVELITKESKLNKDEALKLKELVENVRHAEKETGMVELKGKQATLINKVACKVTHGAMLGLKMLNAEFRIFGSTAVTVVQLDGEYAELDVNDLLNSIEAI